MATMVAASNAAGQVQNGATLAEQAQAMIPEWMLHSVKPEDLKPGDHIYVWRWSTVYAHHGVVTQINPIAVAHFDNQRIRMDGLHVFLKNKESTIHKVKYEGTWMESTLKRAGTCSMEKPDPIELIVMRALSLVNNSLPVYDLFSKNCELFSKYCVLGPSRCGIEDFRSSDGAYSDQSSALGVMKSAAGVVAVGGMCLLAGEMALAAGAFTVAGASKLTQRDPAEIRAEDDVNSEVRDVVEKWMRSFGFTDVPVTLTSGTTQWNNATAATFCEMVMDAFDRSNSSVAVTEQITEKNLTDAEVKQELIKTIEQILQGIEGTKYPEQDEDHQPSGKASSSTDGLSRRIENIFLRFRRKKDKKYVSRDIQLEIPEERTKSERHDIGHLNTNDKMKHPVQYSDDRALSQAKTVDMKLIKRNTELQKTLEKDKNRKSTVSSDSKNIDTRNSKNERAGSCFVKSKKQKTNFEPGTGDHQF